MSRSLYIMFPVLAVIMALLKGNSINKQTVSLITLVLIVFIILNEALLLYMRKESE